MSSIGCEVVVSRRVVQRLLVSAPRILTYLGIPFKRVRRKSFWLSNEAELDYLYLDLNQKGRLLLAEVHPDRGGDPATFRELDTVLKAVKKQFHKKGIGGTILVPDKVTYHLKPTKDRVAIKEIKAKKQLEEKEIKAKKKSERLELLTIDIKAGFPAYALIQKYRMSPTTIYKMRCLFPTVKCPCGRSMFHTRPVCLFRKNLGFKPRSVRKNPGKRS